MLRRHTVVPSEFNNYVRTASWSPRSQVAAQEADIVVRFVILSRSLQRLQLDPAEATFHQQDVL